MRYLIGLFFVLIVTCGPSVRQAHATEPIWTLLKTVEVDLATGQQTIALTAPDGVEALPRSRALRLVAKHNDIVLSRVRVTYATGQIHYEDRRIELFESDRTRPIDPRPDGRVISEVALVFERDEDAEPVTLELWALQAPEPPAEDTTLFSSRDVPFNEKFTEVQVLFGTTRRQEANRKKIAADKTERILATFSGDVADQVQSGPVGSAVVAPKLTLGRAIVTVPLDRKANSLPRPEIDLIITRFQYRQENPAKDFTLAAVDVQSRSEFLASLNQRAAGAEDFKGHAFVFVHGYNVSFDDALYRTAQLAHDMHFDGPTIAYSWPSRAQTTAYLHDRDAVKSSRQGLTDLLELIASQSSIKHVNIIAHSMGNDPVLEVLSKRRDELKLGAKVNDFKLNEVLLAAPDVPQHAFRQQARDLNAVVRGLTLYASSKDLALAASKRFASGTVRAGDVPATGPLLVPGVETIDVSLASSSFFAMNHTTFAERSQLVADMKELFKGKHPPNDRGPTIELIGKAPLPHWRLRIVQ